MRLFKKKTYSIPKSIREMQYQHLAKRQDHDVQLSPIELIPDVTPRALADPGNWGYDYLQADQNETEISRRAIRPVAVFIFDTGAKILHKDLSDIVQDQKVFTDEAPDDVQGHATHVLGTYIASPVAGNEVGICKILREKKLIQAHMYKVLNNQGSGSYTAITKAIRTANEQAKSLIEKGYFVVYNFSLGGAGVSASMDDALREAQEIGVLTVAATGNTYTEGVNYPGKSDYTVAVGAVDSSGRRASFSTWGNETVLAAPGAGIYSTLPNDRFGVYSGTSMATPHVGAVCAILGSCYPEASASDVLRHLQQYSEDAGSPGRDKEFGFGIPRLNNLLANDIQRETPEPQPKPAPIEQPEKKKRVHIVDISKVHEVVWKTREMKTSKRLSFTIAVEVEHTDDLSTIAQKIHDDTSNYFRRIGYILPDQSDEADAAFYVAYFYDLMHRAQKRKVNRVSVSLAGTVITFRDFEQKPSSRDATERNAISYNY